jgi:threonyl-tRNA synthetase
MKSLKKAQGVGNFAEVKHLEPSRRLGIVYKRDNTKTSPETQTISYAPEERDGKVFWPKGTPWKYIEQYWKDKYQESLPKRGNNGNFDGKGQLEPKLKVETPDDWWMKSF